MGWSGVRRQAIAHASAENLLKPHSVEIRANAARQSWEVSTACSWKSRSPADRESTARVGTSP
jgi:hypothetical protein